MNYRASLWLAAILFTACASHKKVIFIPDPAQNNPQEQTKLLDSWQIIESQDGPGDAGIPAWVRSYLEEGTRAAESLDAYSGKYVFMGKNYGNNFTALQQWANSFSVTQDLPRLIVRRVERRMVATAALYPDDEYGEYFAQMIKKVSDGEYPEAVKEHIYWTRQKRIPAPAQDGGDSETAIPPEDAETERFEFLVLISMDKGALQTKIQGIMADIKTSPAPTRDQAAAISKIRQTFFEGF